MYSSTRTSIVICFAVFAIASTPAQAATKYTAPEVAMTLVKAPPALASFIQKLTRTATDEASVAELEALFSDTTEILLGGIGPENQALKSSGRFNNKSPKILQAAKAMEEGERPPGYSLEQNARDNVWRTLAANADRKVVLGSQPGKPGRMCWGPVLGINPGDFARVQSQLGDVNGRFHAIVAPLKIFAKDDEASAGLETLPAKTAVLVLEEGNGGMWEVQTPSGKIGFADQRRLVDIFGNGMCFAKQKDGSWLIDAIVNRTN